MARSWAKELMSMLAAAVLTGAVTAPAAAQPCELQVIKADDPNHEDTFGWSVSARDAFAVVGDPRPDRCYVFRHEGGEYVLDQKIVPFVDGFGASVAYANLWLAVGAVDSVFDPGTVHVFRRDEGGWNPVQLLSPPDNSPVHFGHVVALNASATRALISTPKSSDAYPGGVVFAYTREGETWLEDGVIELPDAQPNAEFGWSLAFDDDLAVVGARSHNGNGTVFVFERVDDAWVLQATLSSPGGCPFGWFGLTVARAGTVLVIGCNHAAHVFRYADGIWMHEVELVLPAPSDFVQAVATDGVHVAVGQPFWGLQFGRVEFYEHAAGAWEHMGTLTGGFFEHNFGFAIAINDAQALCGAVVNPDAGGDGYVMIVGLTRALCCPADCTEDGILDILDFLCFQGKALAGNPAADCNGDGLINVFDFLCFQGIFTTGCP
jgi:hypothetical protein